MRARNRGWSSKEDKRPGKILACAARSAKKGARRWRNWYPTTMRFYFQLPIASLPVISINWVVTFRALGDDVIGSAHKGVLLGQGTFKWGVRLKAAKIRSYSTPDFVPACNISPSVYASWHAAGGKKLSFQSRYPCRIRSSTLKCDVRNTL